MQKVNLWECGNSLNRIYFVGPWIWQSWRNALNATTRVQHEVLSVVVREVRTGFTVTVFVLDSNGNETTPPVMMITRANLLDAYAEFAERMYKRLQREP